LNEKLLLKSPKPFLWITVTPDGKQIIVERKQGETTDSKNKSQNQPGQPPAKPKVQIEFLDSENLSLQRVIKSEGIVNLEALSTGFADVIHGLSGKVWLVRFGPSGSQRQNITRVRSHCVPDILYSSGNMLLVGRCAMSSPDYSVSAFTVTGHFLWRQHWSEHRYTPKIQRSEDGSRVAVSSIARVIVPDPAARETPRRTQQTTLTRDCNSTFKFWIQQLEKEVLALSVAPAAIMAQNISLAPDGRTLVLMQGTQLEVPRPAGNVSGGPRQVRGSQGGCAGTRCTGLPAAFGRAGARSHVRVGGSRRRKRREKSKRRQPWRRLRRQTLPALLHQLLDLPRRPRRRWQMPTLPRSPSAARRTLSWKMSWSRIPRAIP